MLNYKLVYFEFISVFFLLLFIAVSHHYQPGQKWFALATKNNTVTRLLLRIFPTPLGMPVAVPAAFVAVLAAFVLVPAAFVAVFAAFVAVFAAFVAVFAAFVAVFAAFVAVSAAFLGAPPPTRGWSEPAVLTLSACVSACSALAASADRWAPLAARPAVD